MHRFAVALLSFLVLMVPAHATDHHEGDAHPRPYDRNFDAMPVVDEAMALARNENKRLLLVLGANWCHDSRGLAHHFEDADVAALLDAHYVTRHIDIGWRDRNQDIPRRFGVTAIYSTPTVFVIDPETGDLLNRGDWNRWGMAASASSEAVHDWLERWSQPRHDPADDLVVSSLIYQSMLVEIDIYEDEEGERLAAAYRETGPWLDAEPEDRPEDFDAMMREISQWRRALPQTVTALREEAHARVMAALEEIAGDAPVTLDTVAILDARDPHISLTFEPHDSERW